MLVGPHLDVVADLRIENSTKILLARSPAHIHLITVEFRKHSPTSLTRSIKQVFTGTLEKLLLYAVENGKNDKDGAGVCK